jgi:hypothetical protein
VFRRRGLMIAWGEQNILWVILLILSILASVAGVLFSGLFKQVSEPRAHNGTKLLNECLARLQLAFFLYFANISVGGKFDPNHPWMKSVGLCAALLCLIFYGYGLYSSTSTVQDRKISRHHPCSNACEEKIPWSYRLRILGLNLLFAFLSFAAGIFFALMIRP